VAKKSGGKKVAKTQAQGIINDGVVEDLRDLIQQTRYGVARAVNSALVQLYWQIGTRIRTEILKNERAEYGKQIVQTVSAQLKAEFGNGFSTANLTRMCLLAEYFPENRIVVTLSQQLSWSHFVEVVRVKDPLKRDFYAEMCRIENWSVRTLRSKIGGMLFERTALSKKPEKLAEQEIAKLRAEDQLTPDLVFRIDLKLDDFKASDKGQMELYLRWLEKHEMLDGEETPLGLILCAEKSSEKIELLQLNQGGIHVASYLTELPPIEVLKNKLHESMQRAKATLESRGSIENKSLEEDRDS